MTARSIRVAALGLAAATLLVATPPQPAGAATEVPFVEIGFLEEASTTFLTDLGTFSFFAEDGLFFGQFVNATTHRFTDFHFEWEPPTAEAPGCSGGALMTVCSTTTNSADFDIGTGTGIAPGQPFYISVQFSADTEFTAYPTIGVIPLPAPALLLLTALAGLGALRARRRA